ncbi:hypothetical protein [Dysgonomonas sp. BGC7]|uniref:hypothetical protein n=1 Tax=Dysgonomonas sp. BGC7 TaxID=1658008 RepID=UPI000AEFBA67|nr:hypothetical protein [Dysgonomonas sp. BGC7]MBD8388382.1 hypothetical protein [Dysgonomonas sp. BGC7]
MKIIRNTIIGSKRSEEQASIQGKEADYIISIITLPHPASILSSTLLSMRMHCC